MPQIKEYTSRIESQGPTPYQRMNPSDYNTVGNGFKALGDTVVGVSEILRKRNEQRELTDIAVRLSETRAFFTNELHSKYKDGTIDAQEFIRGYDGHVSKIAGEFKTQAGKDYLTKSIASMRADFQTSSFSAQSDVAGQYARKGYNDFSNNTRNALLRDPMQFSSALNDHDGFVDSLVSSGMLSEDNALKFKASGASDLAEASVKGLIDINPVYAKEVLTTDRFDNYINSNLKTSLINQAERAIKDRELEQKIHVQREEDLLKKQQREVQRDFLRKFTEGSLTIKMVLDSILEPTNGAGSQDFFRRLLKEQASDKGQHKNRTGKKYTEIFLRVVASYSNPNKITNEDQLYKEVTAGNITPDEAEHLIGRLNDANTPRGRHLNMMRTQIIEEARAKLVKADPLLNIKDPEGEEMLTQFIRHITERENEYLRDGKDLDVLYNPSKENTEYLGRYLNTYKRAVSEVFSGINEAVQGPSEEEKSNRPAIGYPLDYKTRPNDSNKSSNRKTGETNADFIKRIREERQQRTR